jgi:hypothetical protein
VLNPTNLLSMRFISPLVAIVVWLLAFPLWTHGQTYYWSGNGGLEGPSFISPNNWKNAQGNPTTISNPLANNQLVFGAAVEGGYYNPLIDSIEYRVQRITFTEEALQSYTITAEEGLYLELTHQGQIVNNSALRHTLASDIFFRAQNPGNNQHNSWAYFYANEGETVWSGKAERDETTNLNVIKLGAGKLVLSGDHASSTNGMTLLTLSRGEVVFDLAAGGTFASNLTVHMYASTYGNYVPLAYSGFGSQLTIRGKTSGSSMLQLGTLSTAGQTGPHPMQRLVLDANGGDGLIVTFNQYTSASSPLNIDLSSSPNNELHMPITLSNGIARLVTVTSYEGEQLKTGFATMDDSKVVRYNAFTPFPEFARRNAEGTGTLLNSSTNYAVSGISTLNGSEGYYSINSLTIQGAGSIEASGDPQKQQLGTTSILMEEGFSGDFHINVRVNVSSGIYTLHQYNTAATLYLNQGIGAEGTPAAAADTPSLTKVGAGTVVISGDSNWIRSHIAVVEGRLELHGSLNSVNSLWNNSISRVYEGGILAGSARFGENAAVYGGTPGHTTDRQAQFVIQSGGVLDASNLDGLDAFYIAGKLTLNAGAIYRMTIGENRGNALHVARSQSPTVVDTTILTITNGALLELDLVYAPLQGEIIELLTWDPDYVRAGGQFLTVNGMAFHGDDNNQFFFENQHGTFEFQLNYDNIAGSIYLKTLASPVPEPAVAALLAGVCLGGAAACRRWLRHRV